MLFRSLPTTGGLTPLELFAGGQQYVYVTRTKYDACELLRRDLDRTGIVKARALATVTWCAIPLTVDDDNIDLLPLNEGIVPNDVTVKLRVDNPYQLETGNGFYNDYPTYRFILEGATAIAEPAFKESSCMVYPNPATNSITMEIKKDSHGKETVSIYNMQGQLMMHQIFPGQNKITMDVKHLPAGIYFVEIQMETGRETRKLVIEK